MLLASADTAALWTTAIATCALVVGVGIGLIQLSESKRDRHLRWMFEIGRRWDGDRLEASRTAMYALDSEGTELGHKMEYWLTRPSVEPLNSEMTVLFVLPNFFEDVALTIRYGRLDMELVWQSLSGPMLYAWKAWKPAILVYRREADEEGFTEFEAMVAALQEYGDNRTTALGGSLDVPALASAPLTKRLVSYAALLTVLTGALRSSN